MITIEHLEVDFEVDGDDAAVFERLFHQHIEKWSRGDQHRREEAERASRARAISSRGDGGGKPCP